MARPAIIIGLGGTGQQIVTFLKKELLEIGGGQLPREVKLLAFDTASRVNPQGVVDREKVYRLGNVALEENREYICIGDALYQLAQRIKADQERVEAGQAAQLPHLHWFPAKELIERGLTQAALNTTQGAGTYRTLGRLSLFHSVYSILGHLEQAMNRLQAEVSGTRSEVKQGSTDIRLLEIIVVGSLAGGTGAGTFIDMAWLARAQADDILRDKYTLRGFFLLPTTFTVGGKAQAGDAAGMQGRGFAAWHELDRAMLSGGSGNQIVYNPADKNLHISCDVPAYDITYLIDPLRDTLPIHPPPEEGIFPAVAHLISFLLDEEAGRHYTENLINVLVGTRGGMPRGVYHSSVGGYTLKVPVYYTQAQFSHKLAQQVLDVLLAPEKNPSGRVTHLSQLDNQEAGESTSGLQAAVRFLTGDTQRSEGRTIPNTKLLQAIGQHRARKAREDGGLIAQTASGGLTTSLLPYFNALNQISQYNQEKGEMETHDFTGELQWAIWSECHPRRNRIEMPAAAWDRLTSDALERSVPSVTRRRFGIETAGRVGGAQLRGEFGTELEIPRAAQFERFRELLQAQTFRDLNGENPDARVARGGKLGYVRAFYKELGESLAYFRGFISDVQTHRSQVLKQKQITRDAADAALKRYGREKTRPCWLTFWDMNVHPDSDRACRNWLRAEQRDIDRRRGDILLEVLDEAAAAMQAYTERTLAEIDSWITHLATGDPNFNIESLYGRVTESLAGVEVNHALDQRLGNTNFQTEKTLGRVSQIITEHTFQTDGQMLIEALKSIRWETAPGEDGLKLKCNIELPGASQDDPPDVRAFRRDGENPAGDNLRLLIRLTERPYYSVQKDYPLAKEIRSVYPSGKSLANALHGHVEPFYRFRHGTVPPAIRQAFLRVNDDNDAAMQDYFGVQFKSKFLTANPQLGGKLDKVSSEDRYKLTLVRSDDLMPSESFDQWHICFEPYRDMFANLTSREIHVFTAEQNAARYERGMPRRFRQNYRILHPEVVALLEDRRHFEMFFRAYAHGFIARMYGERDGVKHHLRGYQLPQHDEPLYLTPPMIDTDPPSMFELIHNYLKGKDRRAGSEEAYHIDWQELRQAIAKREQELGREQCETAYKAQMRDQSDGLVRAILQEGESATALPAHQQYREQAVAAHQKYVDLADVAQLIFIEAVERLQQQTW